MKRPGYLAGTMLGTASSAAPEAEDVDVSTAAGDGWPAACVIWALAAEPLTSCGTSTMSIRRFCARPSGVLLVEIGWY